MWTLYIEGGEIPILFLEHVFIKTSFVTSNLSNSEVGLPKQNGGKLGFLKQEMQTRFIQMNLWQTWSLKRLTLNFKKESSDRLNKSESKLAFWEHKLDCSLCRKTQTWALTKFVRIGSKILSFTSDTNSSRRFLIDLFTVLTFGAPRVILCWWMASVFVPKHVLLLLFGFSHHDRKSACVRARRRVYWVRGRGIGNMRRVFTGRGGLEGWGEKSMRASALRWRKDGPATSGHPPFTLATVREYLVLP